MTNCEDMDKAQPGLCHAHAHDQNTKQSFDKPDFPDVAPFVPAGFLLIAVAHEDAAGSFTSPPTSLLQTRTTAPPIAIRNCCFRI